MPYIISVSGEEDRPALGQGMVAAMLESVADVVWAVDETRHYVYVNERLAATQDKSVDDIIGKGIPDIFPPEVAERFAANVERVFDSGERLVIDEEVVATAEGERIITSTISPVQDDEGRVWAVVGAATDITERKRAEAERHRLDEKILQAQKLESFSLLAAGIAHDFNNVLVGVLGNAGLLLQELDPADPRRASAEAIEAAARQAVELAHQVLVYSGAARPARTRVDLEPLFRDTVGMLETVVAKGVRCNLEVAKELPAVEADPTQMRQLLMNLIINASDAIGDRDGEITIGVEAVPDGQARRPSVFGERPRGQCICVRVRDNGCGMSAETASRMFDPLFSTKVTGRGLGLAAVANAVKTHNGAISVDSVEGRGTTFEVLLPAGQ